MNIEDNQTRRRLVTAAVSQFIHEMSPREFERLMSGKEAIKIEKKAAKSES